MVRSGTADRKRALPDGRAPCTGSAVAAGRRKRICWPTSPRPGRHGRFRCGGADRDRDCGDVGYWPL